MPRFINWLLTARRRWVQLGSTILVNSYVLLRLFPDLKGIPCPGFNCYACPGAIFACPIGSLQHFAAVGQFPFYVLGILSLIGIGVGRLACGWLCPFGWFQDALFGLRRRLKRNIWQVSNRYGWLPYTFLVVLVGIVPYITHEPWFSKLCPQGALEAGIPLVLFDPVIRSQAGWLFVLKIAILVGFVIWMVHTARPFCRFVCPLGAIWSPFNRVSTLHLALDRASCTECGACQRACPVSIVPNQEPNSVRCIRCTECVRVCPTAALRLLGDFRYSE